MGELARSRKGMPCAALATEYTLLAGAGTDTSGPVPSDRAVCTRQSIAPIYSLVATHRSLARARSGRFADGSGAPIHPDADAERACNSALRDYSWAYVLVHG